MDCYYSRNWKKVANKSITSECLMLILYPTLHLLTAKQSTFTTPSLAPALGETRSGLRGLSHQTVYFLGLRNLQNFLNEFLPFFFICS